MSAIRSCGLGLGAAYLNGPVFGVTIGVLGALGQIVAYRIGIRPTMDYQPAIRPRITKRQFWAVVNRTVGYAAAGYLSSLVARQPEHAVAIGLKTGLVFGVVTAIVRKRVHAGHRMGCGSFAQRKAWVFSEWV